MKKWEFPAALRLALFFLFFGAAWVVISDHLIAAHFHLAESRRYEIYKDWAFIVFFAGLIYYFFEPELFRRSQTERALIENQRVLSTLTGNLPGMAYRCRNDLDWTMIFVSQGCLGLTGHGPEDLIGNKTVSYGSLVHPEDRKRIWQEIQKALVEKRVFGLSYRLRTAQGRERWIWEKGQGIFSPEGELLFLEGFITDVTEQREAERRIEEQAALLDKARDAILVRELAGRIVFWNLGAERLYGWPVAEAVGRQIEILQTEPEKYEAAQKALLESGEWNGEFSQRTKAGREVMVESRWTLVRDDAGQPQSVLSINTDITERRQLESQVMRAQRMESIGTLAGGMAHDLNNVLAPILMSLGLLKRLHKDGQTQAILEMLEASSQRGAGLLRQVLSFARGVEGKRTLIPTAFVLHEMAKIARKTFPKSIVIETRVAEDVWGLMGDVTQLHQVLLNLCVNARDAMPEGGTLVMSAENILVDEHFTSLNPELKTGPHVAIQVADTGMGIPPEVRQKIFEPFFTTKELGKGTGLGLSTTLAIVKSHGGSINVYSEPGHGTVFKVYLPAGSGRQTEGEKAGRAVLPCGRGEWVLVVDDEASIREVARQTLESFGYRVIVAGDGAEAVALYAERRRDIAVVLTDMMMPVMDGVTAMDEILELNPRARIIVASGFASENHANRLAGAGVKKFLPKPYTAEAMLHALHEILHDAPSGA